MKIKVVLSSAFSILLVLAPLAEAQTPAQPTAPQPPAILKMRCTTKECRYNKLFVITSEMIIAKAQASCKTEACALAITKLNRVVADGQADVAVGAMTGVAEQTWHTTYTNAVTNLVQAVQSDKDAKEKNAKPTALILPNHEGCPATKFRVKRTQGVGGGPSICQQCEDTLETLWEICALYAFVDPYTAIICMGAAAVGFAYCMQRCEAVENCFNDVATCGPVED